MRSAHTITAMTVGLPLTIRSRPGGRAHTVELDGRDIAAAITSMTIGYDAGQIPTARLELTLVAGHDIDEPAVHVELGDRTRALLTRLGWTPPSRDQP